MGISEVRKRYLDFFIERKHVVIPSSSLRPQNDPTTLFTGSGMQPLIPYLLGEKHPKGVRLTDSQKCFRAEDIEEVGDNRHTTFFEMLGNWSLGDYFKEEQISWFFKFLTEEVGIPKEKLWVTCFEGDDVLGIPKDIESAKIWKALGIPEERIYFYDAQKNWWSRSGPPEHMPSGEPGGPDSEVFYEFTSVSHDLKFGEKCHPNCDCGRFMEIGNCVFMEYLKLKDGSFTQLPQRNVDFGGGLERITAAVNDEPDIFTVDVFSHLIKEIESLSGFTYQGNERTFRIIADHVRGAVFMIDDGVSPSNTDAGYVLRRLLRRAIRFADKISMNEGSLAQLAAIVPRVYEAHYKTLHDRTLEIVDVVNKEEEKFRETLKNGMREFEKLSVDNISGRDAFILFTTYGFPYEFTEELAMEKGITVDRETFEEEMKKHQELSRVGSEQKFKGGLADSGEKTTKLHTATHLMLAGLRKYLGERVHQAGSNITAERARFDFTYQEKVSREILDKVEEYVNNAIAAGAERVAEEMSKDEAQKAGVEGSFWERYPDKVTVYSFESSDGVVWSRELCGGPHVENTRELGHFRILKEEASSAGVRRIRAILE